MATATEGIELVLAIEFEAGDRALEPGTETDLIIGTQARDVRDVDRDHVLQAPDVGEFTWEVLGEECLDEGLLVEEIAEAVYDNWAPEGLKGESAGAPFREARLVGVHLIGLLHGVHVEVAVAGLGTSGTAITTSTWGAEVDGDGGGIRGSGWDY